MITHWALLKKDGWNRSIGALDRLNRIGSVFQTLVGVLLLRERSGHHQASQDQDRRGFHLAHLGGVFPGIYPSKRSTARPMIEVGELGFFGG